MAKLVRLWKRPSRDGKRFSYVLIYQDEQGKTCYESLGHPDRQKARRQCSKKERELKMGYIEPGYMRLRDLLEDSLKCSRGHIAEGTYQEYDTAVRQFIRVVGDVDYLYVFVTPKRYDYIQKFRRLGRWTIRQGKCPVSNFRYQFLKILAHAGIDEGTFHDLRRTCITNWFAYGLSEYEVMILAGHASFETTRKFYMAVRKDIIERARKASAKALQGIWTKPLRGKYLGANLIHHVFSYS